MILPATGTGFRALDTGGISWWCWSSALACVWSPAGERYQLVEKPLVNTHRSAPDCILSIDGVALVLVALTAVLVPLLIIAMEQSDANDAGAQANSTHAYFALIAVDGADFPGVAGHPAVLQSSSRPC
ncbi:NADH-quinone oxidoreductase subunit M [Mycolicibacterium aubagnense]